MFPLWSGSIWSCLTVWKHQLSKCEESSACPIKTAGLQGNQYGSNGSWFGLWRRLCNQLLDPLPVFSFVFGVLPPEDLRCWMSSTNVFCTFFKPGETDVRWCVGVKGSSPLQPFPSNPWWVTQARVTSLIMLKWSLTLSNFTLSNFASV